MASLPLLEQDSPIEVAGLYSLVVRQFGQEIGHQVDEKFRSVGSPEWFQVIRNSRKNQGLATYDDPFDPRFTLKEVQIADSPVINAISGFTAQWQKTAKDLQRLINRWQHFGVFPKAEALEQVVSMLWGLSLDSQLPMAGYLGELVTRVRNVRDGVYAPAASAPEPTLQPEDKEFVRQIGEKVQEQLERPPVGADWIGPVGERKIFISKSLRDVTENGLSIRAELGASADELLTAWLRYYPKGGEAALSSDGAVMGFVKGQPKLIGWFGKEPEVTDEEVRGFYLDHEYEYTGVDVRDVQSGAFLSKVAAEPLEPLLDDLARKLEIGSVFNVSVYGDAVFEKSSGNSIKVATVHPGIWFPGQLFK